MTESLTPNLFDWHQAQVERDAAIAQVGDNTSAWWMRSAIDAIRKCAREMPEFTTDDVWRIIGMSAGLEPRAMGAAMTQAQTMGIIAPTKDYRPSALVVCHGRPKRVWTKA